jgi:alcohol dehydrogenase
VVGRIVERGAHVADGWAVGKRVGVGRLGGHCNHCAYCRSGRFELCTDQEIVGVSRDGGYAELMVAKATGLVSIPEELDSVAAAPLLCAGLATFNALRQSGADAGDSIAIHGVGGLGHMAIQYARRMGYRVIAVGRGQDIAASALALGAHAYVDTVALEEEELHQALGKVQAIITTVGKPSAVQSLLPALDAGGVLVVLGVDKEPLTISSRYLVGGERTVRGSMTGTPCDSERAMRFSALVDALPWTERLPLRQAQEALDRLRSGQAQFRIVLVPDDAGADTETPA